MFGKTGYFNDKNVPILYNIGKNSNNIKIFLLFLDCLFHFSNIILKENNNNLILKKYLNFNICRKTINYEAFVK